MGTRKRLRRLSTAAQVVDCLGGLPKVCEIVDANYKQAFNWSGRSGTFPASTYFLMQRALARRGATAPPHLWNMRGT